MNRRARGLVAALSTVLVLGACGGGDDDSGSAEKKSASSSATLDAEPAAGEKARSEAFSFTAPEGWTDVTDQVPGFSPVVAYADTQTTGAFATNVNVVEEPNVGDRDAEELADASTQQLEASGFTDLTPGDTVQVDGGDAAIISASTDQGGTSYRTRQYFLVHDERGWVVTFSYPSDTSEDDQQELAESVMATWAWS